MEGRLLNSTTVYLKWKPPPAPSLNGELQGYKVEVRSNNTDNKVDVVNVGTAPTLLLGNLTSGVSYSVRVAAATRAGIGPFSPPAMLRLDPVSQIVDSHQQRSGKFCCAVFSYTTNIFNFVGPSVLICAMGISLLKPGLWRF